MRSKSQKPSFTPTDKWGIRLFMSFGLFLITCAMRMTQNIPAQYHPITCYGTEALQLVTGLIFVICGGQFSKTLLASFRAKNRGKPTA